MIADPRIMRMQVSKLNQGISVKKKNLAQLKKKLSAVTKTNNVKQLELAELTKRYNETLLKLNFATEESQMLSKRVATLKATAGDESMRELRHMARSIIRQYVEEVRDDVLARKFTSGNGNGLAEQGFDHDEDSEESSEDEGGVSQEVAMLKASIAEEIEGTGTGTPNIGKAKDGILRRGEVDDEKEGADLPFHHEELEEKLSDNEDAEEGNPQGSGKTEGSAGQLVKHGDIEIETFGGEKWLKHRQDKQIKYLQKLTAIDEKQVIVFYTETDENGQDIEYQCTLRVEPGATFQQLLDEACAHWGLMPEYTFLEDSVTRSIWPGPAVVEKEIPLEKVVPELHIIFVQNLKLNELVVLTKMDDLDVTGEDVEEGDDEPKYKTAKELLGEVSVDPAKIAEEEEKVRVLDLETDVDKVAGGMTTIMTGVDYKLFVYTPNKLVRDFIFFLCFMIAMNVTLFYRRDVDHSYWLVYVVRHKLVNTGFLYPHNEELPELDLTGKWTGQYKTSVRFEKLQYEEIANADHIWNWLEGPMYELLHPNKTGHIVGGNTQIVGKIRLRQVRVKADAGCKINPLAENYVSHCYASFQESTQSVDSFHDHKSPGFTWIQGSDLAGAGNSHDGYFASYTPSGFVYDVTPSQAAWPGAIASLKKGLWIDHQTRLIEVSYNVFNPNYNVYATANYWIEVSSSGRMHSTYRIRPYVLDLCFACDGWWFAEISTYALSIFLFAAEFYEIYFFFKVKQPTRLFCRHPWHAHHLLVFAFLFASVISRIYMYNLAGTYLELIWSDEMKENYVDVQRYAYLYELTFAFEALVIFFAAFRIFKFMGHFRTFDQFTKVFVQAGLEIMFFTVLFSTTFFGFAVLAHNIYGSSIVSYNTIMASIKALLKMTVGIIDYEEMRLVDPVWTPVFFACYIVFIGMILINVFLAILNTSYTEVRTEINAEERRLKQLKALRPEKDKHDYKLKDNLLEILDLRKTFNAAFIFVHPAEVLKENVLSENSKANSSNPWVQL
jgi:hypothetical protein